MKTLGRIARLLSDGAYRAAVRRRVMPPRGTFQPYPDTAEDRYPHVFAFVRDTLGEDAEARILSFGCSTGEEVFALRRYLPRATIKGIDIDRANIAACRARATGVAGIEFERAASLAGERDGAYDAIFCMAVLRDGRLADDAQRCDSHIRFADFAAMVDAFARCLRPGGLLALGNAMFRLGDAPAALQFETVLRGPAGGNGMMFGPDNRRIAGGYPDVVFRRR